MMNGWDHFGDSRTTAVGPLNIVCTATGPRTFLHIAGRGICCTTPDLKSAAPRWPIYHCLIFPGKHTWVSLSRNSGFLVRSLHTSWNHRPHSDLTFLRQPFENLYSSTRIHEQTGRAASRGNTTRLRCRTAPVSEGGLASPLHHK